MTLQTNFTISYNSIMNTSCEICGSPLKQNAKRFCSRSCSGKAHRGNNNPKYKGGCVRPDGYRLICVDGIPMLEHRHVMERELGRILSPQEIVHHKDQNKLNNSIDNLELLDSQSTHVARHYSGYRTETHKQCRKCLAIKPRTEFYIHTRAGKNPDANSTRCKSCLQDEYKIKNPRNMPLPPTRCSRCLRERKHQAKGLCASCYSMHRKRERITH